MFKKATKVSVKFELDEANFSQTTEAINGQEFINYLKYLHDKYGQLVIPYISDNNNIHITTNESTIAKDTETRIQDISDMIRLHINNQAISQDGFAVFAEDKLKGVFGEEVHANLKQQQLIRQGYNTESIRISPISIGDFKDFE